MALLGPIQGPECVHCGCEDSSVVSQREWRGLVWETRQCAHCGHTFNVESPTLTTNLVEKPISDRVIIFVVRCPKCGEEWPPVTRSMLPVRYHKCDKCKHTFKSVEQK